MWYLLMFLPTIGFVQVGSQRLADRYLGWPLIGLIYVVCYGIFALAARLESMTGNPAHGGTTTGEINPTVAEGIGQIYVQDTCAAGAIQPPFAKGRRVRAQVLGAIALGAWTLGLGWQARALCVDWSDDLRLYQNAMIVGGVSSSMLINCSALELGRNDRAASRRYAASAPDDAGANFDLAVVDLLDKKYDAALYILRRLYSNNKLRLRAAIVSGRVLDEMGRPGDAKRAYQGAINFLPPERSYLLDVESFRLLVPKLEEAASEAEKKLQAGKKE
jgi:hypothetical protein